jgi:hypothetical protein
MIPTTDDTLTFANLAWLALMLCALTLCGGIVGVAIAIAFAE